ncbi:MAG: hypothetical protein N5P05_003739 [Chroococcopsis gigantea SAG 12.99]|jgi:TM2 domain-containing membrane protein YozV|nr:hypothetical protein [Chroococcopsis gigantea SAG 12.99]
MKSRAIAAIIAFFLGPLGIHKFYLNENVAGLMYFIFSWTFIPSLFAFFDFIGLLLTSDEAFNAKYNGGLSPSTPYPPIAPSQSSTTTTETLLKLKKLYDSGVITAEEYEEKRRKYLDSL